jgi:hypothetical protein
MSHDHTAVPVQRCGAGMCTRRANLHVQTVARNPQVGGRRAPPSRIGRGPVAVEQPPTVAGEYLVGDLEQSHGLAAKGRGNREIESGGQRAVGVRQAPRDHLRVRTPLRARAQVMVRDLMNQRRDDGPILGIVARRAQIVEQAGDGVSRVVHLFCGPRRRTRGEQRRGPRLDASSTPFRAAPRRRREPSTEWRRRRTHDPSR